MSLLSVIVPTYNESGNMRALLSGLNEVLNEQKIPFEIIVMDDNSPDKTAEEVDRVCKELKLKNVRAVVRTHNRGLSPAVIDGFEEARGDVLLVMDADLSHPIGVVPALYRAIADGAEVAVGSRHCPGGGIVDWPLKRQIISFGAAMLARPLTPCTDPMAGFFALKKEVIKGVTLNAAGFKILLEILVKGNYTKLAERPIVFKDREIGVSKLSNKVMINYLTHLFWLYLHPGSAPLLKFLVVGAVGALLDVTVFTAMLKIISPAKTMACQAVSFMFAITWNFIVNRIWTFKASKKGAIGAQLFKFVVLGLVGLALRSVLYGQFVSRLGLPSVFPYPQITLIAVIVIVSAFNFVGAKLWAFK
eukprot:TRINITY_DN5307_c0_g1_i1.p1 TRINITY_DN5307_c0_g1~~TRINITY_DN5307_c0_g1_i1.p1  ORF type:complete len:361 (+),score=80.62 TRINITY_DN5307_c0_g1_i1:261-1343(+)